MASATRTSSASTTGREQWYYIHEGKKQGPVSGTKLTSMIESGKLDSSTRVWTKGMANWSGASETAFFSQSSTSQQPAGETINFEPANPKNRKRKSRWWIWVIVAVAVLGIAAAVYFLFLKDDAPKPITSTTTAAAVVSGYNWEETTLFENDECAFIIDSIGEKGDYLELDVRCVNKTGHTLSFAWECTSINGSMFDPLWSVWVNRESTLNSSITFPLTLLDGRELLPADELKFILAVYDETEANLTYGESLNHIFSIDSFWYTDAVEYTDPESTEESYEADPYWYLSQYQTIEGYENYLFTEDVQVDKDGRPFFIAVDNTIEVEEEDSAADDAQLKENERIVYFDEILDRSGMPVYQDPGTDYYQFYNDPYGRPYYFSEDGEIVYYEGYGFAFYDEKTDRRYYYDEDGDPAYYGIAGNPEKYDGTVTDRLLETAAPTDIMGAYVVHQEYTIHPTDMEEDEITYPERITTSVEQVYWEGEKGSFIVLNTEMDAFEGFIVHIYVQNNSDNFVCFYAGDVTVNGIDYPDSTIKVLRGGSNSYWDIVIPKSMLEEDKITAVEAIKCRIGVIGENMAVPLYPIEWNAP